MTQDKTKAPKPTTLKDVRQALSALADKSKAGEMGQFFKTGPGEYGEGDRFIGVSVPAIRTLAKTYINLSDEIIVGLVGSPIHEERMLGLIIWTLQMEAAQAARAHDRMKAIAALYIQNRVGVNNWDLVDLSCYKILGPVIELKGRLDTPSSAPKHHVRAPRRKHEIALEEEDYVRPTTDPSTLQHGSYTPKNLQAGFGFLRDYAQGGTLWEKRIAMVTTYYFINQGESTPALEMATILMHEREDLLQKAVGWMLREVGKRCDKEILEKFLKVQYKGLGRTALRYAIEHFDEEHRQRYLSGRV